MLFQLANSKYTRNKLFWTSLDVVSYTITYAALTIFSALLSLIYGNRKIVTKLAKAVFFGPFLFSWSLIALPFFICGQLIWLFVQNCGPRVDYAYVEIPTAQRDDKPKLDRTVTVLSWNALLGLDALGAGQNMWNVFWRMTKMRERLRKGMKEAIELPKYSELEQQAEASAVVTGWPDCDFLLFQEVWDRFSAWYIINSVRGRFNYFVADAADSTLAGNYGFIGSGLLIASKYPIVEVKFVPFERNKVWQKVVSYGCLIAKIDLDGGQPIDATKRRRIGFITNVHAMAYQEGDNQLGLALDTIHSEMNAFQKVHTDAENENVVFSVIGGDFNLDNISPCDVSNNSHPLLEKFIDVCSLKPGRDKHWAVGTELRQLRARDPEVSTPAGFKRVLDDLILRRHYVIDADVQMQTMNLMYCDPEPEANGEVIAKPEFGGLRRIDRLLYDHSCPVAIEKYAFLASGAGLSDHIPVAFSLKIQEH